MCTNFYVALLSLLCVTLTCKPVSAAESAERFLRVPFFFITDRNLLTTKSGDIDFGPHRKYLDDASMIRSWAQATVSLKTLTESC